MELHSPIPHCWQIVFIVYSITVCAKRLPEIFAHNGLLPSISFVIVPTSVTPLFPASCLTSLGSCVRPYGRTHEECKLIMALAYGRTEVRPYVRTV
jgi:hypothetical protein